MRYEFKVFCPLKGEFLIAFLGKIKRKGVNLQISLLRRVFPRVLILHINIPVLIRHYRLTKLMPGNW